VWVQSSIHHVGELESKEKKMIDGNGGGVTMAGVATPLIFPFFGFSNQPSNV
jgi:hypothetical protein